MIGGNLIRYGGDKNDQGNPVLSCEKELMSVLVYFEYEKKTQLI